MFLTFIFLLIFSFLGVAYDCAKISASYGYVKVAGDSAACTLFGNYNQELYREYGLLGYGGYDGMGTDGLNREFQQILEENIETADKVNENFHADIYRLRQIRSSVDDSKYLTDKDIFYSQISMYLKKKAVKKATDAVLEKVKGTASEADLTEKLDFAEQYESGEYQESERDAGDDAQGDTEKGKNSGGEYSETPEKEVKDSAGGNPLEMFSHMVRDGVLGMVCREEELSEKEVAARERDEKEKQAKQDTEKGAADFLKKFLKNGSFQEEDARTSKGKDKMLLLAYDRAVFPDYSTKQADGVRYALEYLVSGKREEKSNLASVVNRLLTVRTLLNFAYVAADPILQEKSMATATALAGFTGLPPVITGVQYTILLILSFQEACVDVTALLDGKSVPVLKNSTNFKMRYEEICLGSRSLFQKKAAGYAGGKAGTGFQISYQEYLMVFLLSVSEHTLRERTLDVIQQNLRDKYNQSFCIDDCISRAVFQINYETDYIFQELPFLGSTQWGQSVGEQCQEVGYGYKSG